MQLAKKLHTSTELKRTEQKNKHKDKIKKYCGIHSQRGFQYQIGMVVFMEEEQFSVYLLENENWTEEVYEINFYEGRDKNE